MKKFIKIAFLIMMAGRLSAQVIAVGFDHTGAILANGTVKAWGCNDYGQLGQGNTTDMGDNGSEMGDDLSAVSLGSGRTAKAIACGEFFTAVILDNNTVKAWGRNNYGQLGQGNTTDMGDNGSEMGDDLSAVSLGSGRTATAIATGLYHTAVILDNGTVKAWGRNEFGQLGQGNTTTRGDDAGEVAALSAVSLGSGRTATAIACGLYHTAVILDNGTVKIWGQNSYGQLGQEDIDHLGDEDNEMGDDLSPVSLGSGRTATAIACGKYHTAVILDNGTVKVWGFGFFGQLGQGGMVNLGDGSDEMGDDLSIVSLGSGRTATAIACGEFYTAVVLDNGTVKVWGRNNYGQLGQGNTTTRGDGSNEMGDNLAVTSLGSGRTGEKLATGCFASHAGARLDNGTLKFWGRNNCGQLGQGNTTQIGDDAGEVAALSVVDLSSGSDVSLPVELASFHVLSIRSDAITLQWITESEINNLGFILDRRVPGTGWTEIANYITSPELQGQGSITYQTIYTYIDNSILSDETYDYRLADVDYDGNKVYHSITVMGVSPSDGIPESFKLYPAYPNPFNPITTLFYDIPEQAQVRLTIYDLGGRQIAQLVNSTQEAGFRSVKWDATDNFGNPVSAGVYLYQIQTGEFVQTRKIVLLK